MNFTCTDRGPIRRRTTDSHPPAIREVRAGLTIDALERLVAEEERVRLDDAFTDRPSLGAFGERERTAQQLRALNKKNADFWKNGGVKPAA